MFIILVLSFFNPSHADLLFFINLALSIIVTIIHGRGKEIGWFWTFIFSLFLTPLAGYLMAYYSPKWKGGPIEIRKRTSADTYYTIFFLIISDYLIYVVFQGQSEQDKALIETGIVTNSEYVFGKVVTAVLLLGSILMAGYISKIPELRFQPKEDSKPVRFELNDKKRTAIALIFSASLIALLIILLLIYGV